MDDAERQCIKCEEFWPDDAEFFNAGKSFCIACEKELKKHQPNSILLMPAELFEKQMRKCREARSKALENYSNGGGKLAARKI